MIMWPDPNQSERTEEANRPEIILMFVIARAQFTANHHKTCVYAQKLLIPSHLEIDQFTNSILLEKSWWIQYLRWWINQKFVEDDAGKLQVVKQMPRC